MRTKTNGGRWKTDGGEGGQGKGASPCRPERVVVEKESTRGDHRRQFAKYPVSPDSYITHWNL